MPLKKTGKKILEKMEKKFGEKKGEAVFYASINAKKPGSKKWHEPKEPDDQMIPMDMMSSNSPLMKYGKKRKK